MNYHPWRCWVGVASYWHRECSEPIQQREPAAADLSFHFAYVICLLSCNFLRDQRWRFSCIAKTMSYTLFNRNLTSLCTRQSTLLYLIFFIGAAVSGVPSVLNPFWGMTLLLFVLMYELAFSFARASYFALFLQRVEKRFFTALSVLHRQPWI